MGRACTSVIFIKHDSVILRSLLSGYCHTTVNEVTVCSKSFSALIGRKVALSELLDYPLISLGTNTKSFEFHSKLFTAHGLPFQPDIEAFTADQILPMVEADLGIGFVPEEFLQEKNNACIIDLKEKIPERNVVLIKRKDQSLNMASKELERMILEQRIG